jgi:NADH dehydrogenase
VLWLFIHLMNIVSYRNRILVFLQWGWNYLNHDRSARLITGGEARRSLEELKES